MLPIQMLAKELMLKGFDVLTLRQVRDRIFHQILCSLQVVQKFPLDFANGLRADMSLLLVVFGIVAVGLDFVHVTTFGSLCTEA